MEKPVREFFEGKIAQLRQMALDEVEEDSLLGRTRAVFGPGAMVEHLLFGDECITINIRGLPPDLEEERLTKLLAQFGPLRSFDLTQGRTDAFATATFRDSSSAAKAIAALGNETVDGHELTVTRAGHSLTAKPTQVTENNQLVLSWATEPSKCEAVVVFSTPQAANAVIDLCNRGMHCPGLSTLGPQTPGVRVRAMVAPPLFRFDTSSRGPSDKYSLKLTGLYPCTDEVAISAVLRTLSQQRPQVSLPKYVKVHRAAAQGLGTEPVGSAAAHCRGAAVDEQALSIETAELTAQIPQIKEPSRLLSCTSFFDTQATGRAGFYLQYKDAAAVDEALEVWHRREQTEASTEVSLRCGQPVRLEAKLSSIVRMHSAVFKFYESALKQAMTTATKQHNAYCRVQPERDKRVVKSNVTSSPDGRTSISVCCINHAALRASVLLVTNVIVSTTFSPADDASRTVLFSFQGRTMLAALCKSAEAYIHWDKVLRCIQVYAHSKAQLDDTLANIQAETPRMCQLLGHSAKLFINSKKRRAMLEQWYKLPFDASSFRSQVLDFNVEGILVTIRGSEQGVTQASEWLAAHQFLTASQIAPQAAGTGAGSLCSVCYCDVENPFWYRTCGHGGCTDCCEHQFCQIEQGADVPAPVQCFSTDCNHCKMALSDIMALTTTRSYALIKEAALMKYVREHAHEVRTCPNQGCSQLLDLRSVARPTDDESEMRCGGVIAYCDQCDRDYCLACSDRDSKPVGAHSGAKCSDSLPGGLDEILIYVRQISEILTNHCPHCNAVFLEWEGCAAVTCASCRGSFCGGCLTAQRNDSVCHAHVLVCSQNPGKSYWISPEQVDKAHRQIRVRKLKELFLAMPKGELKRRVLQRCEADLRDVNISPSDVV
jgi:hypothetical protein